MENEIKNFFSATAPQPSNETAFQLELNARLAAVEQIRQFHDREVISIRRIALTSLIIGLVLGVAVTVVVLLQPDIFVIIKELFRTLVQPIDDVWNSSLPVKSLLFWFFAIVTVVLSIILPVVLSRNTKDFSDYIG